MTGPDAAAFVASEAVALAKQMLAPGSVYTFSAYRDARRLAELVLAPAKTSGEPS